MIKIMRTETKIEKIEKQDYESKNKNENKLKLHKTRSPLIL